MKKALWFDVETTGLSHYKNDIIQFACLVEIEGKVVDEYETKIRPFDLTAIDPKALEVNGLTLNEVKDFPDPKIVYNTLVGFLSSYVDKFKKEDISQILD